MLKIDKSIKYKVISRMSKETKPCYIMGTAYDNIIPKGQNNNGVLSKDTITLLGMNNTNSNASIQCNVHVSSNKKRIYKDPAIALNTGDIHEKTFTNLPILEEHGTVDGKKTVVGKTINSWFEGNKVKVEAVITDSKVCSDIRNKVINGFSVGYVVSLKAGRVLNKIIEELSVCRKPVFEKCLIDVRASNNNNSNSSGLTDIKTDFTSISDDKSTLFNIDEISDSPVFYQNNNLVKHNNDKHSLINRTTKGKLTFVKTMNEHLSQQPQQQQTSWPSSDMLGGSQQQQQQQQQPSKQKNPSQQQNENEEQQQQRGEKRERTEKNDTEEEDELDNELYLKKLTHKAQKASILKEKLRRFEQEEQRQKEQYVKDNKVHADNFMTLYKTLNKDPSETVAELIRNSYSTPDLKEWGTGLTNITENFLTLKRENQELQNELKRLAEDRDRYQHKLEKSHKRLKFLKNNDGLKVSPSSSQSNHQSSEKTSSPSQLLFGNSSKKSYNDPTSILKKGSNVTGGTSINDLFTSNHSKPLVITASHHENNNNNGRSNDLLPGSSVFSQTMLESFNDYANVGLDDAYSLNGLRKGVDTNRYRAGVTPVRKTTFAH